MKQIVFMTPKDAGAGFALTGVRQVQLQRKELWPTLDELVADDSVGVVAVDARLVAASDRERLREIGDEWQGVLVTLPAPADRAPEEEDEVQRLVQRALGYHVRLRTDEGS